MMQILCRDCCQVFDGPAEICDRCGGRRLLAHAKIARLGIAHIDCDAFYAAVEKRDRPDLGTEPLIVGHSGGRGVVVTACYVARTFGVRSAMPMFQALQLCPHGTVIQPDMAKYKRVSETIRAIFASTTTRVEPLSLDEAYLDLADEHRLEAASPAATLARIAKRIEEQERITVSIGLSCNKFLAKLASEFAKPRGFSVIGRAEAKALLAPMSVRKIHGVGAVTARRMEASGLSTIADLQALTEQELVGRFGKLGSRLALFAHGNDDRGVTPFRPVKSISAETTFGQDTASGARLREVARGLCERVARELARKGLAGLSIVLKLKTSDFRSLTRSRRLLHPTQRAELIFASVAALIDREADGRHFRLIGVGIGDLGGAAGADPTDLFSLADMPKLPGANLLGANLMGGNFQGANLQAATAEVADVQGAEAQRTEAQRTEAQGTEAQGTPKELGGPLAATQRGLHGECAGGGP
ncbi:MAG TPA: DNA polymerase IV [Hyphomicrobiaceae bacterium]|nr:DNA polymerase IV [Hyphomicrobiaceae bacterium]